MKRQPDVKEVIPLEDIYMFSPVPFLERVIFFPDIVGVGLFIQTLVIFSKFGVLAGPKRKMESCV